MTTGALIFAYNNEQIDSVSMAAWTARNIRRHLNIPVALVTDNAQAVDNPDFAHVNVIESTSTNQRYFPDFEKKVTWHNTNRTDAYALTPWDQTLVLDADYVVASDMLKSVLHSSQPFLAHRYARDIIGQQDYSEMNYFGDYGMPMWWATVMMFRRDPVTELLFDTMQMIRDNWPHYKQLYQFRRYTYRNDYALSIALNILHGHSQHIPAIPWNLESLSPLGNLTQLAEDQFKIEFNTLEGQRRYITIINKDFHAMGKKQLGEIVAHAG